MSAGAELHPRVVLDSYSFLPAPTQLSQDQLEAEERLRAKKSYSTVVVSSRNEPPPYEHRKGWVPRALEVNMTLTAQQYALYGAIVRYRIKMK